MPAPACRRCVQEFPDLATGVKTAIAMARQTQDPLPLVTAIFAAQDMKSTVRGPPISNQGSASRILFRSVVILEGMQGQSVPPTFSLEDTIKMEKPILSLGTP
jgi:hypothetical protein